MKGQITDSISENLTDSDLESGLIGIPVVLTGLFFVCIVLLHAKIHKCDNDGIIFCLRSLYMLLSYQRTCIAVSPILE